MKIKDICTLLFSIPIKNKIPIIEKNFWITQADLKENNVTEINEDYIDFDLKTCIKSEKNDILIKRNNPTYVNIYDDDRETYLGNNLVIVRTKQIDVKYLAFVIEQQLEKLNALTNNSTFSKALNREMLEQIDVMETDTMKQKIIGEVWLLNKKKNQLIQNLMLKEKLKQKIIQQKIYNNLGEIK